MSRILNKRIDKMPIRSPSPDIANRHIIARTSSPINDAMAKLRQSKSSKYPLGRSFLNSQQYQAYIRSLQEKNRLLTQDNRTLYEETMRQSKEIDFLKETNLKHRKQIYKKSQSQKIYHSIDYSPDILTEYERRIGLMSQQVKRIHELLDSQKNRNERLLQEIELLQSIGSSKDKRVDPRLKKELTEIEESLITSFDKLLNQYQNKVDMVIQDQIGKVNQVQKNQRNILKLIESRNKYDSPSTREKSWKNHNSTSYKSPNDSRYKNHVQSEELQCLNCRLNLLKITNFQQKIIELQKKLKEKSSTKLNYSNLNSSHLQSYLEKLQEIKMILTNQEIIDSINTIQQNLSEIYSIDQKFEYMKKQKNDVIQELKEKEIEQTLQILALKKEKEILRIQINQQMAEIEKLKELLALSIKSLRKDQNLPTSNRKANLQGSVIRKYIEQALTKIDSLEQQLEKDINI